MKSFNPLVTVLMPVYNGEKYLAEAIESVLNQTFADFELLIIDDCSSDNSVEIIQSYNDNRLKLIINEENIGQSKTLNKGIEFAKGKYIARLDQDDLSYKERLQIQIEKISDSEISIMGSWANVIDTNSQIIGYIQHPVDNESIIDALGINCALTHSSIFMKREDVVSLGGYSKKYKIAMDWELWVRAALNKYNFFNIPEYLSSQRQHRKQTSKNNEGKRTLNREILSIVNISKSIIKTNKNLDAFQGWKYYYDMKYLLKNINSIQSIYALVIYSLNLKALFEFLKIFIFHKVLKSPQKLYNVPFRFLKKSSVTKSSIFQANLK